MKKGIDVSKYQGAVDWKKVRAAGISFAILRAGYGRLISQKDPFFDTNAAGAAAAGIAIGAYWYSYALSSAEARTEADVFLQAVKGVRSDYPLALDLEDPAQEKLSRSALTDIASAFLEKIREAGFRVMLYTNPNWQKNHLDMEKLGGYDIWLARYSSATPENTDRSDVCAIWQYASDGTVEGIEGRVSLDVSYRDYALPADVAVDTPKTLGLPRGATYQFRLTSEKAPVFQSGNPAALAAEFAGQQGYDYFYKVTAAGKAGEGVGVYVNGKRRCVVTILPAWSDTTGHFTVPKGKTYQFKVSTDRLVCGSSSVFHAESKFRSGGYSFLKFRAVGSAGDEAGFYLDGAPEPVAVGEIVP